MAQPDPTEYIEQENNYKNQIFDYVRLRLADQLVDVELDKEHYELGYKQAMLKFRQLSQASVEESYAFLPLLKETQEYILDRNIMEVRQVFRRGIGSVTGTTASQFEPFASGYLNTYMLVAGRVGGLTNYELFVDYQKLAMRMFGGHINFSFNRDTKKLTIVRKIPENGETVLLWIYNYRPNISLLNDYMVYPWIQDYTYSFCKFLLGEGRGKFKTIAGPQGGTQLNGEELKAEAKEEFTKLEEDIKNHVVGSQPLTWIQG